MNEIEEVLDSNEQEDRWNKAIMMKYDGVNQKDIAKEVGVSELMVHKWFNGSCKGFTELLLKTSLRRMVDYVPVCSKVIQKQLGIVSEVETWLATKKNATAEDMATLLRACEGSSERAVKILEVLWSTICKVDPSVSIVNQGGVINVGRNQQIVAQSITEAKEKTRKLIDRMEKLDDSS